MPNFTMSYVLVRGDLSPNQQVVQAIHAGMGAADRFGEPPGNHLVLLSVRNKAELVRWLAKMLESGIRVFAFTEEDDEVGLTALATEPLGNDEVRRRVFAKLPLWNMVASVLERDRCWEFQEASATGMEAKPLMDGVCRRDSD